MGCFTRKWLRILYRMLAILLCGYGISRHFQWNNLDYNIHMFSFFTIQCNILCFITFSLLFLQDFGYFPNKSFSLLRGMALSTIILTNLSYHFFMHPLKGEWGFSFWSDLSTKDIFVHYLVPFFMIFDWLFWQKKGSFQKEMIFLWLLFPFSYFSGSMVRAACHPDYSFSSSTGRFPYEFLNMDILGVGTVLLYAAGLGLLFVTLSYILYRTDSFLS